MASNELVFADDDGVLQDKIASKETEFNQKCSPPKWLSEAESPFKWLMSIPKTLVFFNRHIFMREHQCKLVDEDPDTNFSRFHSLVALMTMTSLNWYQELERGLQENEEIYCEIIKKEHFLSEDDINYDEYELENVYSKCKSILEALKEDEVFSRIGPALEHVLEATRAHILYMNGNITESVTLAQHLQPVEKMTLEDQAGIEGAKLQFMMSVCKDNQKILEFARQVVKMDANFGTSQFICGILTRRLRKEQKGNESAYLEEIDFFERAYELHPCVKHLLFVAQAYQEVSSWITFHRTDSLSEDSLRDMQKKSVDLFRQCWSIKNDTAPIARRVGNSLMKIKHCVIDKTLAKEALLKAVELTPNRLTYHALGRFYYRLEKNDEKALECFEKAGSVFGGTSEIVRLKLIKDPLYDPYDIVQEWIQVVETQAKPESLYCDIGWYYLFFRGDLETSVKYFWKVLSQDFNSPYLLGYNSYVFCVSDRLNVLKLLVNEILLLKKENKALPSEAEKNMEFLGSFLAKVIERHPELGEIQPSSSEMPAIRCYITNVIQKSRHKRYGFTVKTMSREEEGRSLCKTYNRYHLNSDTLSNSDKMKKSNTEEGMRRNRMNNFGDKMHGNEDNASRSYNRSSSFSGQHSQKRNRFDVTFTDWRAENRSKKSENPYLALFS